MHFKDEARVITVNTSKTTGPGKKVELIISVCAYIEEDSWLKRGFELMKEMGSGISRDYSARRPHSTTMYCACPEHSSADYPTARGILLKAGPHRRQSL